MSPGKHDPAALSSYLKAHENHMARLARTGVVVRDGLRIRRGHGGIVIEGDVEVEGGVIVRVHKRVAVVEPGARSPLVQTKAYSYNVHVPRLGTVVRHDGPDHHRDYHHVHRYDLLAGDVEGTLEQVDDSENVPSLAEVITEAYAWCMEHRAAIDELRRGGLAP